MILGRAEKPCVRCGQMTVWSAPGQSKRGFCAHHAKPEPVALADAIGVVMDVFEVSEVVTDFEDDRSILEPVQMRVSLVWHTRWDPHQFYVKMLPPEAGPCLGCQRPIRRYGPLACAYCKGCRP